MAEDRRVDLLAKQLARHYRIMRGINDAAETACACTGLDGVCLNCSIWWKLFLTCWNSKQVERMVRSYLVATEEYYAG